MVQLYTSCVCPRCRKTPLPCIYTCVRVLCVSVCARERMRACLKDTNCLLKAKLTHNLAPRVSFPSPASSTPRQLFLHTASVPARLIGPIRPQRLMGPIRPQRPHGMRSLMSPLSPPRPLAVSALILLAKHPAGPNYCHSQSESASLCGL